MSSGFPRGQHRAAKRRRLTTVAGATALFVVIAIVALLPAAANGQTPPPDSLPYPVSVSLPVPLGIPPAAAVEAQLTGFPVQAMAGLPGNPLPPKPKYRKLDRQLSDIAETALQGLSVPSGLEVLTHPNAASSIAVSIHFDPQSNGLAERLSHLPGVLLANQAPGLIEAYVPAGLLAALDADTGVVRVSTIVPPQPLVTSQGAAAHNSPNWNSFGLTGTGIKVGIIDVGFIGYGALIGTELPTPVAVRCYTAVGVFTANIANCQTGDVHGAAVAEAVMDVAPGVSLYLANPFSGSDLLATAQWMVSQGVQVINHSVGWTWDGPGNGTSISASSPLKAVDAAAAGGIVWVNSAGNANQQTWSGSYADANANNLMEFSTGVESNDVSLAAGQTVRIQARWEDAWGNAARDLDLYLYNSAATLVASSQDTQNGGAGSIPYEFFSYTAAAAGLYHVKVGRFSGTAPSWVEVQVFNQASNLSIGVSGHSIGNPAESASPGMLTVGAANWATTSTIESFSSQGPTRDNRVKPDLVGADRGDSVTYGPGGFGGTSQASPHVAGLAAIARQAYPSYTPAQIVTLLKSMALPRLTVPNNTWGSGFAFLPTLAGKAVFTQAPGGGSPGSAFPVQPVVTLKDASNATLTGDNSTVVTLSLLNAGGATLSCTGGLDRTVVAGVANFAGCQVNNAAAGYQLAATPNCACAPASSPSFTIAAAGTATKLAFSSQPASGTVGVALSPLTVQVQDASSAVVTGDNTTQVTLSKTSGPGILTCAPVTAASGVANFANCTVSAAGSYVFHAASSSVLTPADTASFAVVTAAATLGFTVQP
ncbi:MAG: S8 family serine peptidase, partial [Anaerolineaceae bacterium]